MGTTAGIVVNMYESMISCAPATKALYPESPTPYVPTIDSASFFLLFFLLLASTYILDDPFRLIRRPLS